MCSRAGHNESINYCACTDKYNIAAHYSHLHKAHSQMNGLDPSQNLAIKGIGSRYKQVVCIPAK